jgi:cell division protein FtsI (penicillin-binding protein 3)
MTWFSKILSKNISRFETPISQPSPKSFSDKSIRLEGSAKVTLELGKNRLVIAGALFAFCFVILAGRLIGLAMSGDSSQAFARPVQDRMPVVARLKLRQEILDRNGVLLATSLQTPSLFAEPNKIPNPKEAAEALVTVLPDLSQAAVFEKLSSGKSFVWLKRNLSPSEQYAVNALGIPTLSFQNEEKRIYPQGALISHVLGYTDVDNNGIAGVEDYFDARLGNNDVERPSDKGPLVLSLDMRVQHAMRDELTHFMSLFRAVGAAGLVMDVNSGEVLSMVSLPDFDPNRPSSYPDETLFNRTTLGVYEMGSTFKTFTVAMGLNEGKVGIYGGYDATKPIRKAGFRIRDDHAKKRWLSVPEIFMYSSNIGAAKMADDVGPKRHKAFLGKLGLLRKSPIELPEVGAPLLPARWNSLETMTISFGHGLSVSPVQLVSGISAIINGGNLVNPTIVKRDPEENVVTTRVISKKTSNTMRKLLRLVVEKGTGRQAAAEGYLVGGKTGTAEKVVNGRYNRDSLITSFVGVFPMHKPQYIVLAVMDEPKGNKQTHGFSSAGWTAAPIVGRLVSRLGPLLGVAPVDEESEKIQKQMFVPVNSREKKLASF